MSIRFISKKERESLKKKQEDSLISQGKTNNQQRKIELERERKSKDIRLQQNTPSSGLIQPRNSLSDQQDIEESQRQRSREKKFDREKIFKENQRMTKQEKVQRQNSKKIYLGLVKQSKSNRFDPKYKDKLLFQWNDSDDTFGNSGVLSSKLAQNSKKLLSVREDFLNKQKFNTWKDKSYFQMTERDWRIFRQDNQIFIKGGRVPHPIRNWQQGTGLDKRIIQNLKNLEYTRPKPIQMQTIPIGLLKKDLIGMAPTGQGKTLAYLLPALQFILGLQKITAMNSSEGPYVLVLVPSRQLAEQIQLQFNKVAKNLDRTALTLVGGKQIDLQALGLQKGADILIGTPGRIKQLIQKKYLSFERCSWVIVDQADKMISENLIDDIEFILKLLGSESVLDRESQNDNKCKVTHMFSATMAPQIQKLIKEYLVMPSYVSIGDPNVGKKEIEHYVDFIDENQKNDRLGKILRNLPAPVIVFVNRRNKCANLVNLIEQKWNRRAVEYHGERSQEQREKALDNFRKGKSQVLVATDLAGRGLDVLGVTAVINYDAPKNINEFIHRAGRTGRAGMKGKAYTLITASDEDIFYDVKQFLEKSGFKIPEALYNHPAAQVRPGAVTSVPRRKQVIYTN